MFCIVRDHMGITPLYIGWGDDGSIWVASEMKAIHDKCPRVQQFPPGHMYCNKGENVRIASKQNKQGQRLHLNSIYSLINRIAHALVFLFTTLPILGL